MRRRRSLYFPPRRKQPRPGRPSTGKVLNKNIRVGIDLLDMVECEHKHGETYNDTLLELLRERNFLRLELSRQAVETTPSPPPLSI